MKREFWKLRISKGILIEKQFRLVDLVMRTKLNQIEIGFEPAITPAKEEWISYFMRENVQI